MTSSLSFFCEECGAANATHATMCFACNQPLQAIPLALSLSVQAPEENTDLATTATSSVGLLLPGTVLAQCYLIESQIGQGGFGIVYKAKDRKNRCVAIKQISLHGLNAKEIIEATDSYNREIRLLSTLKHPNLPRIYDHFTDAEHWYLVMDFINGQTLEEYLDTGGATPKKPFFGLLAAKSAGQDSGAPGTQQVPTLPVKEVLDIGVQLCTVLDYLHMQQPPIIFRDVKPANIMRTHEGRLYLIDFGIARRFAPGQARDTGPLGSVGYAAPEQYGKAQTTKQTDIYGLGATLQTLLTGKEPLELSITGGDTGLSRRPIIPKELQRLLNQMLDPDSNKRPKSVAAVGRTLQYIKDGAIGLIAAYFAGLLIGVIPYCLIVLLGSYLYTVTSNSDFGYDITPFAICTSIIVFAGQFMTGALFLSSAKRRVMGLGILTVVALPILCILMCILVGIILALAFSLASLFYR